MKIKLFKHFTPYVLLSIFLLNCTSDKLENTAFVEIISKNNNQSDEIDIEYNLKVRPQYFDQNHKIIFYGVSVETMINDDNYHDSKVNDIIIFNPVEVATDCVDTSVDNSVDDGFRNEKFIISYNSKGDTLEFVINGKKHKLGNSKANFNQSNYPRNSFHMKLNKPIILLALNEAREGENGIKTHNVEIGCVVYDCVYKVDWKKFFSSQEFIQHAKFNLAVWNSQKSIADEENLSVQKYYLLE